MDMNAPARPVEMFDTATSGPAVVVDPFAAPYAAALPATISSSEPLTIAPPGKPMRMADVSPADLLRIAIESGDKDLDRLERLANMVREWRREEAKLAFRRAFSKFTALGIVIPKSKHVQQKAKNGGPGPNYWQTEYHVVMGLLKPALGKLGFSLRFDPTFQRASGDGGVAWCTVTCHLEHDDGHSESVTLEGPPDDSGAKNALQEMQSSSSFLMRHAAMAITATAQAGADNDGRGARGDAEDAETQPDAALVKEGEAKVQHGLKALLDWWKGLTAAQREPLMPNFGAWRAEATKVDKQAGRS